MFKKYIIQSDRYMLSLFHCMDNAHAAEKMYDWGNVGEDNIAWQNGPFLSGGEGGVQIPRTQPYCLKSSDEFGYVAGYQMGPSPIISEQGGVELYQDSMRIKSTEIIPTVAINVQFAILEAFDHKLFGDFCERNSISNDDRRAKRYDRRPVLSRLDSIQEITGTPTSQKLKNAYSSVSNFRNKLTHEPMWLCCSPLVAFDVYGTCQAIAFELTKRLTSGDGEETAGHRLGYWDNQLDKFSAGMEFE